jgi:penicillin-insensitive murein endopeptidase
MRTVGSISTLVLLLLAAPIARSEVVTNPWPRLLAPSAGPARAIGDYSAGCLQGAAELPLDGVGYQVMRPSRKRYYGHPALIDVIRGLGKQVRKQKLGVLLIGDLSQPRGGKAATGHASHQTGLDVDIWFWHPERARKAPLPMVTREELSAQTILDDKASAIRADWKQQVTRVLQLTAADDRVERVFVNPVIKRELCAAKGEHAWLRKIRPWHGHDDHFHVRLSCVAGESDCQAQAPLPEGDGCDKLAWWFNPKAQAERKQAKQAYQETVAKVRAWPERCDALLEPAPVEPLPSQPRVTP